MSDLRMLRSLIRLNKNVFFNSFKKSDTWIRILTIIFLVYMLFQSLLSGSVTALLVKSSVNPESAHYFFIVNVGLFVLFALNIFSSIFLTSSKYSENVGSKLAYYPLTVFKKNLFGILAAIADLYNLPFVVFYAVVIIILGNVSSLTAFLSYLAIFCMFIFLTGSLIYLLKNLYLLIVINHMRKKIFTYAGIVVLFLIIIFSSNIVSFIKNSENLKTIGNIVFYLPSGILAGFIIPLKNSAVNNFIYAFIYFLLANILFYVLNNLIQKKLKARVSGINVRRTNKNSGGLATIVKHYTSNPIYKKDLLYSIRSTRELMNNLMLLVLYTYFIFMAMRELVTSSVNPKDALRMEMFFILFHLIFVLRYSSNIFGYDYSGVINYFSKPFAYSNLLVRKLSLINFYVIINFLSASVCLIIVKISGIDYLYFISFVIITYLLLKPVSILFSFYFPFRINFYGLSGMNVSFITFIYTLSALFAFIIFAYISVKDLSSFSKIIVSLSFLVFSCVLFYFKNKMGSILVRLMLNKKEKIISVCS